jgi:hypothetical protein
MAAAFAATMVLPVSDRRFSADRWEDNERHAAGQWADQQRMADYYACQTQQQGERKNAEAQERFAEGQRKDQNLKFDAPRKLTCGLLVD